MSTIKKFSGAKKRKSKRNRLIKEVASQHGQLKISNIFLKSVDSVCQPKLNDTEKSIDTQDCTEKVQGSSSFNSINVQNIFQTNFCEKASMRASM